MVSRTACTILGLPDPLPDAALNFLALPIKLGGLGLRPLSISAPAAFWSSFALAAPDILSLIPDDLREVCLAPGRRQLDFAYALDRCFKSISDAVGERVSEVLPETANGFWLSYERSVPPRLQRAICSLIDQRVVAEAFTSMSRTDKQRVVSCQANGSGSWLTVIPSSPDVSLTDAEFRYAVRHRLGLPPSSNLPARCRCGAQLGYILRTSTAAPS